MKLDEAGWQGILDALPPVDGEFEHPLAVAFILAEDFAAKRGPAWLWWPGSGVQNARRCGFDGSYPDDWGLLLVMSTTAVDRVREEGVGCMSRLVRHLDIKPFILRQRDQLDAAGILEFIESLELATPKH